MGSYRYGGTGCFVRGELNVMTFFVTRASVYGLSFEQFPEKERIQIINSIYNGHILEKEVWKYFSNYYFFVTFIYIVALLLQRVTTCRFIKLISL